MKKLFALTLLALLAANCSNGRSSKGSNMTFSVQTQAELDQANQRINAFKQELLQQGFREVSISSFNTAEVSVLEGQHGRLRNLRVTLKTNTQLLDNEPEVAGGINASIPDDEAEKEYDALYSKVVAVVTGRPL